MAAPAADRSQRRPSLPPPVDSIHPSVRAVSPQYCASAAVCVGTSDVGLNLAMQCWPVGRPRLLYAPADRAYEWPWVGLRAAAAADAGTIDDVTYCSVTVAVVTGL